MLLSGGNAQYLEMPRSNLSKIISMGRQSERGFEVPSQKDSKGWFSWGRPDLTYLSSLWYMSRAQADWELIEKVRQAGKQDWNRVIDMHNKMDTGHDAPWLRYLAGANPDYPEKFLASSSNQVAARLERMRQNWLLIDEYPGTWRKVDPDKTDFTKLNEHHWQGQNPVTTEALVQLMLGAPQIMYNGGLLHASVRYFDPANRRPGIPPDVAALVTKLDSDGLVLELVNMSPFKVREVIVQAGTFGEHQFTTVRYQRQAEKGTVDEKAEIQRKFFQVRMQPASAITLNLGVKRYQNRPSHAFPWHGDAIPIK